jgi:hypothetical protein
MNIQDAAKRLGVTVERVSGLMSEYGLSEKDLNDAVIGDLMQDVSKGSLATPVITTPVKTTPVQPAPSKSPAQQPTQAPGRAPMSVAEARARKQQAIVNAATVLDQSQARVFEKAAADFAAEIAPDEEALAEKLKNEWLNTSRDSMGKFTKQLEQYQSGTTLEVLGAIPTIEVQCLALEAAE